MGAILDIIGSYIFKAAMIGIIFATSMNLNTVMVQKNQLVIAESNLNVAISIIEWDLKNIGYNTTGGPTQSITLADLYKIRFMADVNNDGVQDDVMWWYQYKTYTEGIGYRYDLNRTVNGVTYTVIKDLFYNPSPFEVWRFYYLDKNGAALPHTENGGYELSAANRLLVRGIKVFMSTKSALVTNNTYIVAKREFSVYPANLSLN